MTLLYPRKSGTGDPVKGKYVPDHLVSKFLKNGFMETPDITNEKAAEHFFQKKLGDAQTQLRSEAQKLADEKAELAREKAEFYAIKNGTKTKQEIEATEFLQSKINEATENLENAKKIDGRSKEAKAKQV